LVSFFFQTIKKVKIKTRQATKETKMMLVEFYLDFGTGGRGPFGGGPGHGGNSVEAGVQEGMV
jgi:hypothetical protein